MTNDNILLITFGEPGDGLNNFTITGRDWIKLEKWMETYRIADCYGVNNYTWYEVARDITPTQQRKFHTILTKKEAQEFIVEYIGEENWRECVMDRAKAMIEERRKRILSGEFGEPNEEGTMVKCFGQWIEPIIT